MREVEGDEEIFRQVQLDLEAVAVDAEVVGDGRPHLVRADSRAVAAHPDERSQARKVCGLHVHVLGRRDHGVALRRPKRRISDANHAGSLRPARHRRRRREGGCLRGARGSRWGVGAVACPVATPSAAKALERISARSFAVASVQAAMADALVQLDETCRGRRGIRARCSPL